VDGTDTLPDGVTQDLYKERLSRSGLNVDPQLSLHGGLQMRSLLVACEIKMQLKQGTVSRELKRK
jgi:hypothetical protein